MLRDVAAFAGVSVASASRVLANRPGVSPQTRTRVIHAAEELGYEPNRVAQGLRRGQTMGIACILRDISVSGMVVLVQAAEQRLRDDGYHLIVADSAGRPELDAENVRTMRQRQVDGMIVSPSDERHAATLDELRRAACPIVAVDRELPDGVAVSTVGCAHEEGMGRVVAHLVELGHRRLALVA